MSEKATCGTRRTDANRWEKIGGGRNFYVIGRDFHKFEHRRRKIWPADIQMKIRGCDYFNGDQALQLEGACIMIEMSDTPSQYGAMR